MLYSVMDTFTMLDEGSHRGCPLLRSLGFPLHRQGLILCKGYLDPPMNSPKRRGAWLTGTRLRREDSYTTLMSIVKTAPSA